MKSIDKFAVIVIIGMFLAATIILERVIEDNENKDEKINELTSELTRYKQEN